MLALLIVVGAFGLLGLLTVLVGWDSRPSAYDPPSPQWPFYRHRS